MLKGQIRLGILGGGQLARMLAESAFQLGYRPVVLAGSESDPAAQLCPGSIFGSWDDPEVLSRFLAQVDVVVFENEFVPRASFESAGVRPDDPRFYPRVSGLYQLQDKLEQKRVLSDLEIPTAPWELVASESDLERIKKRFKAGYVLKWATLGYDGKGTWIFPGKGEHDFFQSALSRGVRVYAEQKVEFRRELAVAAVRSSRGEFSSWPLVITTQERGICRVVKGPASAWGVDLRLENRAQEYARKIADSLEWVGCLALEFFETGEGDIWVNEIAPRVHNSAHFTQDASLTSQFENHLRAVLGLRLGDCQTAPAFGMVNLLGDRSGASYPPVPPVRGRLHWYGKLEVRPGRKMGHINFQADSAREIDGLINVHQAEKTEREVDHG